MQASRQIKTIVAANIRSARKAKGLTQRELGRAVNDVDALAVYRWEKGTATPNATNFAALANALERDIAWFYTDHAEPSTGAAA
jgi:transcriptional regulator with XRE-family HTH domain